MLYLYSIKQTNNNIMKTGYKKFTATSENFNSLQSLRNVIKDAFCVAKVKWGGSWNGMNWENFSFYCTPETLTNIESFCRLSKLLIAFQSNTDEA